MFAIIVMIIELNQLYSHQSFQENQQSGHWLKKTSKRKLKSPYDMGEDQISQCMDATAFPDMSTG